jgi:hypothetical protein
MPLDLSTVVSGIGINLRASNARPYRKDWPYIVKSRQDLADGSHMIFNQF